MNQFNPAAPQPPSNLQVAAAPGQIELIWGPSPDPAVAGYAVYRRNPDGSWPEQPTQTTADNGWLDLQVTPGVEYAYRVAAVDRGGQVSLAQEGSAVAVGLPEKASGGRFGVGGLIASLLVGAVLAGGGAYVLASGSAQKQGEAAGLKKGKQQGLSQGRSEVQARFEQGGAGYKQIYDTGYQAGLTEGQKALERDEKEVKVEKAELQELTKSQKRSAKAGAEAALGGFTDWLAATPYLITMGAGDPTVPFNILTRHELEPGWDYFLCASSSYGICRAKQKEPADSKPGDPTKPGDPQTEPTDSKSKTKKRKKGKKDTVTVPADPVDSLPRDPTNPGG